MPRCTGSRHFQHFPSLGRRPNNTRTTRACRVSRLSRLSHSDRGKLEAIFPRLGVVGIFRDFRRGFGLFDGRRGSNSSNYSIFSSFSTKFPLFLAWLQSRDARETGTMILLEPPRIVLVVLMSLVHILITPRIACDEGDNVGKSC